MNAIYDHEFKISGYPEVIDGIIETVRNKRIFSEDSAVTNSPMDDDIDDDFAAKNLLGSGEFDPQEDGPSVRTMLQKVTDGDMSVEWFYRSLDDFRTFHAIYEEGKEKVCFDSSGYFFINQQTACDAGAVLKGNYRYVDRLSKELIECEKEDDNPYLISHLLSVLFVLHSIDYRPGSEHGQKWLEVVEFIDEIDTDWVEIDWASEHIDWLREVAVAANEVEDVE